MNRLEIDWTRCEGHGLCSELLPAAIELDEWGYPIIVSPQVATDDPVAARRAVALCPSLALRIELTERVASGRHAR